MLTVMATDEWRRVYPGAAIGLLEVRDVTNGGASRALDEHKRMVEAHLRERYGAFTRADFLALPVMAAYERYYKRFGKTYHVQLQLESIVLKGKNLPSVSPLVDANFAAEVETMVLTAGHDAAKLQTPVLIDIGRAGDQMTQMNGARKDISAGDMLMRDAGEVSCTIIYGQDNRSPISPQTTHALYVAYAPPGVPVDAVEAQVDGIAANIRRFAPAAVVEQRMLISA